MSVGFYFSITETPEEISQTESITGKDLRKSKPKKNEVGFLSYPFHDDIKELLWFGDSPLKNLDIGSSIKNFKSNGLTCYFADPSLEEPSVIITSHPIEFPRNTDKVDRPPYYPVYRELTPLQKGVYFTFLKNPYDSKFDVAYIFLLFYGLERHLQEGKEEEALKVILKLRNAHKNKSFQKYTANTLILTAIHKDKGEIALELLKTIKPQELHELPITVYLLCASSFNIPIKANDLMYIGDWFGFTNKNYIKKCPEQFESTLSNLITQTKGRNYLLISDYLTADEINSLPLHPTKVYANVSLRDIRIDIPFLTESEKLRAAFTDLLKQTHETVKKTLAEQRKTCKQI